MNDEVLGDIQDILCDIGDGPYVEGAHDFAQQWVIENDDMVIINDAEALWECITGVLHTPLGKIDVVGLEGYGSELLTLRGQVLNYHIKELAKVYIKNTIPQFKGRVKDFPVIKIDEVTDKINRRTKLRIFLTVDSIYGRFSRTTYI